MSVAIALLIQDFVNSNRLLSVHVPWSTLVSRGFAEDGAVRVFSYSRGPTGTGAGVPEEPLARVQRLTLPDAPWLRIELGGTPLDSATEHRIDVLRLLSATTHSSIDVSVHDAHTVFVCFRTRHPGRTNLLFVIRDTEPVTHPFLVSG